MKIGLPDNTVCLTGLSEVRTVFWVYLGMHMFAGGVVLEVINGQKIRLF